MLLAMKTRNVMGAFWSVLVTVKQSFIVSRIVSCLVVLSSLVLLDSVIMSFVRFP